MPVQVRIWYQAGMAQLAERNLAKVDVAGSNPFPAPVLLFRYTIKDVSVDEQFQGSNL